MREAYVVNEVAWKLDPTAAFISAEPSRIAMALGHIPAFFHPNMNNVMQESLATYGYHVGAVMTEGTLKENGAFLFPGDPPQYPLASAVVRDVEVFIYQHAVVAYRDADKTMQWVRMD